ncbi:MAG TPA: NAD(P)/FAD-dependent oxidoreductase [Spongiibacteraceae bacterium]|nr:NAD(P)/FAD-dependent oxidoreductase [Spongiibacteraceae bacterium]
MTTTTRDLRIVVIGAGMAGILAGIKLLEAGRRNFTIYEKADRIGGTWRENTYPGLTCDVPSHAYTYSFAPNPDWSRHLPPGAEIQAYFENIVARYGVAPYIRFNEGVTRCVFESGRWQLETSAGNRDSADVVVAATGVLHHPSLPDIQGQERFKGAIFHTARWDHSVPLDGRRVGIIGNGSTGVQTVSALVPRAAKVAHFQRTAQWIMPVENGFFSDEQKAAFRADPELLRYMQNEPEYLANVKRFTDAIINADSQEIAEIESIARANLESSVSDPVLREKLRPDYRAACKRLIYSPDYYHAIQQPNAALVNEGIECIEEAGVRTRDGTLHELDVIALATGFKADMFMRPMHIEGRDGARLNDVWARRPYAYLAISIPDFPNLYMLNGPTGPVGNFSLIDIAERQWAYIEQLIATLEQGAAREISVTTDAMQDYERSRIEAAKNTIFASGCRSWYLDAEGVPASWPWSYQAFADAMAAPDLSRYEVR